MLTIGPSTGWMYADGLFQTSGQEKLLSEAKATAVEVCWAGYPDRAEALLGKPAFGEMTFRSLHVADIKDVIPDTATILDLMNRHQIKMAVTHPLKVGLDYPQVTYEQVCREQIRLAIENMDKDKDSGFAIDDLLWIIDCCPISFVLDVQHAYEHDPSMIYARELFEALKYRLEYLHVSGEAPESNHCLLSKSTNADEIISFLGEVLREKMVPMILEGEYTTASQLSQEIAFITKELDL